MSPTLKTFLARSLLGFALALALTLPGVHAGVAAQSADPAPPFGTLREQADRQQRWLQERLDSVLPGLMRKYAVDPDGTPRWAFQRQTEFHLIH